MRTVAMTRNDLDPWVLPEYRPTVGWFVYYLWRDGALIYVGKTTDLDARMRDHRSKGYDRATYSTHASEQDMTRTERAAIDQYKPPLNRRGVVPQVSRRK